VYKRGDVNVKIICPEHGEFEQKPVVHVQGYGCAKCSGNVKLTTEEFIKKAKKVHGDRYDYSKVNYTNNRNKIIIICSEHGEFKQAPQKHLNGQNCPTCTGNVKLTTADFIRKAKEKHGDKYDYSKTEYKTQKFKVIIICPEHGEFEQNPSAHLYGHGGCPKCHGRGFTYLSYEEAKKIIHPIMESLENLLKRKVTFKDYKNWWVENEKYCQSIGLPKNPQYHYNI